MGVILCIFRSDSILAFLRDMLEGCCKGIHRGVEHVLSSLGPISSIPVAFNGSRLVRAVKVSCMEISMSERLGETVIVGGALQKEAGEYTERKYLLKRLAFSSSDVAEVDFKNTCGGS